MEAVCVEEVLALLVALDAALGAADALARDAPQQPLALVAVRRLLRRPQHEVVRRRRRDRVNHSLQRLLVHVQFLSGGKRTVNERQMLPNKFRDRLALTKVTDRTSVPFLVYIHGLPHPHLTWRRITYAFLLSLPPFFFLFPSLPSRAIRKAEKGASRAAAKQFCRWSETRRARHARHGEHARTRGSVTLSLRPLFARPPPPAPSLSDCAPHNCVYFTYISREAALGRQP